MYSLSTVGVSFRFVQLSNTCALHLPQSNGNRRFVFYYLGRGNCFFSLIFLLIVFNNYKLPSLLMISIPTLLTSVTELQLNLTLHKPSSLKSIENLTSCVRNLHRYITQHVSPHVDKLNLGPFEQLTDLARKATHSPSELVYEQADRILTLVWNRLQDYGEVAFKHLYLEEFPLHMQIYDQNVAIKMSDLLQDTLSTCIEYIQVKHDTSHLVISLATEYCPNLETMLFVDRSTCHFVLGSLDKSPSLFSNVVLQAYKRRADRQFHQWSDGHYRFVYLCHPVSILIYCGKTPSSH